MSTRYASFWVFDIARLPWLNDNFVLLQSKFTRRTSLMKNAYLQRHLEDVFLFPKQRRTVVTKSRKNVKFVIFAISVKIVKSAGSL